MVALADKLPIAKARTFEKVVNRRAHLRLRPIPTETRTQPEASLGLTDLWVRSGVRLTNLHRWYDPNVGRWISEDPIGFAAADPNLYRYVGNSPTTAIDPNGLNAVTQFLSDYWYYLTNPDEMDEDLRAIDKVAKEVAVTAGTTAVGLRGAAELSRLRHLRWLNQNRYCRIGPGRMGGPGRTPRISIGQGPGNPHIDLRVRPIDKF